MDARELSAAVAGILGRHPAVGLALGVVRGGTLDFFVGHGLADDVTGRPVTEDTVFRVASITKTFTAIAVLQLVEQGLVDLDEPANAYLRTVQLVHKGEARRPATVRHLLTHTAGIGEEVTRSAMFRRDFGESVPAGQPVPALAEFYRGRVRLAAEPGTRFRYGNHSPALLGQLVEDVSREPLGRYLREQVFRPLGMTDTDLDPPAQVRARLATGYRLGRRGARAVPLREFVTAGAASAYSTPRDMARYVAALLGGGTNEHGTALKPDGVAEMFAPQYRPDPRIPGMGLAFFRGEAGGRPVVEHQGVMPGFDSQVFLAPDDAVGIVAFTNGTRQGGFWLPSETGRLLDDLLGVPHAGIRGDVPHHPEIWADLRGLYVLPGPLSDVRIRGAFGAGFDVVVRKGRPHLRMLSPAGAAVGALPLHPDDPADPYAFRVDLMRDGLVTVRVVFSQDGLGRTTAMHLDLMPITAVKRSAG
ncbi:serine hydrolase domain-containing protein [Petropleomorpha daqingensis]|uniref:CubicO group peptidase (Beta-lactamase class C family) n=1 Tax=Petropleomorpha daqingensis TaxID=2026353 RepID=A0A853CM12_9ACTN|nr:serine hydrolase domain-containing protein [Petropleomorpha daqingensis]NYJ08770.1 CubicO group peptidase (beta-lactamase class C family) [Petropleomorpha daqingensis]